MQKKKHFSGLFPEKCMILGEYWKFLKKSLVDFSSKTHSKQSKGGFFSFFSLVLLPILSFSLGWIAAESNSHFSGGSPTEFINGDATIFSETEIGAIDISLLKDAVEIIRSRFITPEDIDSEKIKYGIVQGLVWSLDDPYSEFMSPEESQDFEHDLDGEMEGIGAELTVRKGVVVVVSPLRDSPAEKSGLLPEDIIIKVDGEAASGDDFLNVVKRIRGKKGSTVVLDIFRPDTSEEKEITITRDKIRIETVKLIWKDSIAVLEISKFGTNTEREFNSALSQAIEKNASGIVLDLRFNSGGFLDTAVDVVSAFQQVGKVVIQKGKPPETNVLYTTGNVKTDLPLVVLQNRGSASASEIVSGAIQDLQRGVVIGDQSFGKGSVQELISMQGGAHLKLTVAKWLTPNERDISEVGITPDLFIKRTTEDFETERDPQLDFAVRYLQGESLEDLKRELEKNVQKEKKE
jgi:carboxyl-terminal processing protease